MMIPKTVGLPRMRKENGEKRVFLPEFVTHLVDLGATVCLEAGYGARLGYAFEDYRLDRRAVRQCSRQEAFQQDLVMVLRSPRREDFNLLRPGACLMSMLHYPTRPARVERLTALGLNAISLDSIANDDGLRLVENMRAVAWNGLEAAFDVLERQLPGLRRPDGLPVFVLILGAGMVAKHAVEAATKLGNVERYEASLEVGGKAAVALVAGRSVTQDPGMMRRLMARADVLVDATSRHDPSQALIPNAWLGWLPRHAVIVDLSVDPYLPHDLPPVVRGIEGIPQGNLDQYVFTPDDPNWCGLIAPGVPTDQRRTTVTCYSWPGIHPDACMAHYGRQLRPLMEALFRKGYDGLSLQGDYFERALARATLREWLYAEAVLAGALA